MVSSRSFNKNFHFDSWASCGITEWRNNVDELTVPGRVRSIICFPNYDGLIWNLWRQRNTRRWSQNRWLYRRNIKKVERIIRFGGPSLDQRHQWIAWLPGLWRVCSRARIVCSRRRSPSSSPEDRISRRISVISLSSSIDLRRSAGLSISLFFAPMVYEQERWAKDTPGRKTWKMQSLLCVANRQFDNRWCRNCQSMAFSKSTVARNKFEVRVAENKKQEVIERRKVRRAVTRTTACGARGKS